MLSISIYWFWFIAKNILLARPFVRQDHVRYPKLVHCCSKTVYVVCVRHDNLPDIYAVIKLVRSWWWMKRGQLPCLYLWFEQYLPLPDRFGSEFWGFPWTNWMYLWTWLLLISTKKIRTRYKEDRKDKWNSKNLDPRVRLHHTSQELVMLS